MQTIISQNVILSAEEYLIQEEKATIKSEYHNGEVVAMAGTQLNHNLIVSNLIGELYICLKGKKCKVLPSDMLLKLPECNKFVYPDVTVVCQEIELDNEKKQGLEVLLNPSVVIEVLSESTRMYDKTEKLSCYLTLESLKQYVMIDSQKFEIITFTRNQNNDWLMHTVKRTEKKVKIGECEIEINAIYDKVGFEV